MKSGVDFPILSELLLGFQFPLAADRFCKTLEPSSFV